MTRADGYRKKTRNRFGRKRRPMLLIAAEGKNKTEKNYFKKFGSDCGMVVSITSGGNTDPVGMLRELKAAKKENGFCAEDGDLMYCLIDSDFLPQKNKKIKSAIEKASAIQAEVIISSPCFEVWFLSHYRFSSKEYCKNDEVIKDLENYIDNYSKSSEDMYGLTKYRLTEAIDNAKKMEKECLKKGKAKHTVEFMPSTEVYRIAEKLLKVKDGKTNVA